MFAPRLIKLHGNGQVEKVYEPNALENLGDRVLQSIYFMWKLGVYTSPLLVGFLYRRGYFEYDGCITLTKVAGLIGGILAVSYVIRSLGRSTNPMYQKFVKTLSDAQNNLTPDTKQKMAQFDFEFYAWPVEFKYNELDKDDVRSRQYITKNQTSRGVLQVGSSLPCHILGYLAVHTFGIRLIYPGSLSIFNNLIYQTLIQGRSRLIDVNNGQRYKLETKDENQIDSMFIDRRNTGNSNGSTLVVCCEGNAGFYEIGIACTPISMGYSVLAWNHPGFAGSSGKPYPPQELNAIDAVMQFAIKKLGFRVENILVFGWSIGGFTSTWAAMNYPDIKGLILDASFDDILPLAINTMPSWSESIVRLAIREHVNLNNAEQLIKYPGPVLIIRRTEDEVICLEPGDVSTNRGNNLLMKMLLYRYPIIFGQYQQTIVQEYLALARPSAQDQYLAKVGYNNDASSNYVEQYMSQHPKVYPSRLGEDMKDEDVRAKVALFLVRKHFKDYKATHCTPLPADMFQLPWEVDDFVFT